ncbi:MAG: 3'-5' exonuclease domain-containing protein 2 [Desulfovibrio sp.]|nr:3'-5' exonuclease domain-containing protein 2 [Desulfovibrio sp.]
MLEQKKLDIVRRRLTAEEINALPLFHYTGPVYMIRDLDDWDRALPDLRTSRVLGFDTETRPTFRKGKVNAPSLVQLATGNAVYLVQLSWLSFGPYISDVLADANILKVGVGIRFDMQTLTKLSPFVPAGLVDLGTIAKINKLSSQGLRSLSAAFFGWRISKGSQCSNWSLTDLSQRQIIYAATDAWVGRLIFFKMKDLGFVTIKNASTECHIQAG